MGEDMQIHDHQLHPSMGTVTKRTLERYPDRVAFSWEGGGSIT